MKLTPVLTQLCKILSTRSTIMSKSNKSKPLIGNQVKKASSAPLPNLISLGENMDTNNIKYKVLATPVKSESDKKDYKVIQLENGLTACLIADRSPIEHDEEDEGVSDESEGHSEDSGGESEGSESGSEHGELRSEQKMAAASLSVGVGSFSDPKDIPGMAHFLEHMVFMGSEKFPEENDFDSFISKRGGSDNASTDCEVTTFYFECLEKHIYTALDKFAQFFISPLMKKGAMTREREAIESEFQMALPSNTYRKEQLIASFARADSPVNGFTWGNLKTLRDNVSDDKLYEGVHEFRKRHYSAHRMTLAIQARLPMDVLTCYVLNCFHQVPTNNLPPDDFKSHVSVFDTPQFTRLYYVQPTNNVTQVDLTWALPSLLGQYKTKPHQYISWILGHEGRGSLLAYLRRKVWVLSMVTGNGESGSEHNTMYSAFSVIMTLTEDGLRHMYEVIEAVFSYINLLKKLGPQQRIFDEIKQIEDTSFRFAEEDTPVDWVEDISESMQFYPPEFYITGSRLYSEYNPKAIENVLNALTPSNMNVMIFTNTLPEKLTYDRTEKWFGTKYTERQIPQNWIKRWETARPLSDFSIPPPNLYLCTDFTILKDVANHPEYPRKVLSDNLVEMWYRKDQKFKLPTAYYYFYLISPAALETPLSYAKMACFLSMVQIQMIGEYYSAQVAELSMDFSPYDKGAVIKIMGYNQKIYMLVELITRHLCNFNDLITKDMFEAVKEKLVKHYLNNLLKPSTLAKDVRLNILVNNYHSMVDKYNALNSITFEDMKMFARTFLEQLYVKVLVQGNVTEQEAVGVVRKFVKDLKYTALPQNSYPKFRVIQVPTGESLCLLESFNRNDSNSIITNYYQSGPFSIRSSVIIDVIMLIIQEPLFNTLRTKEQLGYHIYCSSRETFGILGFTITVNAQATKNTTKHVNERIEEFLKQASKLLNKIDKEEFEETKRDLIKTKQITDVHLKDEVSRNWYEIIDEDYMFDRVKLEIATIEALKLKDVQDWWKSSGCKGNCRKLSVQVSGFNVGENDKAELNLDYNTQKNSILTIKFLDSVSKQEGVKCVRNVDDFKENLYLFPVVVQSALK